MSLSYDPTFTPATTTANVQSSYSLPLSGVVTSSVFYVGAAGQTGAQGTATTGAALSGSLQVLLTTTNVAGTAGLTVQVFRSVDGTNFGTYPYITAPNIPAVASTTARGADIDLPPGIYKLVLTNLDGTNAVTVSAEMGTTG